MNDDEDETKALCSHEVQCTYDDLFIDYSTKVANSISKHEREEGLTPDDDPSLLYGEIGLSTMTDVLETIRLQYDTTGLLVHHQNGHSVNIPPEDVTSHQRNATKFVD